MLTAGLLDSEYVGLVPRAKEICLEGRNQLEIMQFAMMSVYLDRSDLIHTTEEEDR